MEQTIRIPTEIVDHIIALVLTSSAHSFASIASLSLASSDFRQIALRLFFSTIKARSRTRWAKLWNILASANRNGGHAISPHTWVRYVTNDLIVCIYTRILTVHTSRIYFCRRVIITTRSLLPASSCLCAFTNLQSLAIDFANEDTDSQDSRLKFIFKPRQLISLASLTSLTFTSLAFIDTDLLTNIADNFPSLQVLKISCTERLDISDPSGFIDAAEFILHSPITSAYDTASELAVSNHISP